MKKLLLTLGSAAAVVAPVATVVACGDSDPITLKGNSSVVDGHLTLSGFVGPTYTEDEVNDDYDGVIDRLSTFSNLMGVQLVAAGSGITKVTLTGELAGNDGQLEDVSHTTDFANVAGADDLTEYIASFTADEVDTASGQAFMILSSGNAENVTGGDGGTGGDTDTTPAAVTAKIAAIGQLDVTTTEADTNSWDANSRAMDATEAENNLGIATAEFAKIEGLMDADFTFNIIEFDLDANALIVSFDYMGTSYDATLSGLVFTPTP